MNRTALYVTLNAAFAAIVSIGMLQQPQAGSHALYLIALFALCTSSMFGMRQLHGRFALLCAFSATYFLLFGALDAIHLLAGEAVRPAMSGVISTTEALVLMGGVMAHAGYRLAGRLTPSLSPIRVQKDWSEQMLLWVGGVLWITCTVLSWQYKVNVISDMTTEATTRGLASISDAQKALYILAVMVQPLGILMLAYAQSRYRRRSLVPVLISVVFIQLVFGFIIDVKGEALIGAVLVILTKLLVDGKLPKVWLVASVAFIAVAFPVLQANRHVRAEYGVDRPNAAQQISQVFERSLSASKGIASGSVDATSATFFERMSLKGIVEMIVSGTSDQVEFQHGHTLTPILTAFIPRLIWPSKPDVQAGQLLNKEFRVSEVEFTYISPSHLGELYWNYGWTGAVLGMLIIGMLLGFLGARFSLSDRVTLARIMVVIATIRLIILGFESSVAAQYVLWIRSMLAIGVLHFLFARQQVGAASTVEANQTAPSPAMIANKVFVNLMR